MPRTILPITAMLLISTAVSAQIRYTPNTPTPAQPEPLRDVPVSVRTQPLSSGAVTHEAQVRTPPGEAAVTVRSIQPSSVVGNYRIRFSELDVDGDGFISREEAQANPALALEFDALDTARRGRLDRAQLAGWLID